MIDMLMNSITLFVQGKLFKNPGLVLRQSVIGIGITALLCLGLSLAGLSAGVSVLVSALLGGGAQPWLFKDLKYA